MLGFNQIAMYFHPYTEADEQDYIDMKNAYANGGFAEDVSAELQTAMLEYFTGKPESTKVFNAAQVASRIVNRR